MADARYPMLRRRKRRRRLTMPAALSGARVRLLAIGLLCLIVVGVGVALALRPPKPDARRLLADSLATLDAGNYSAARTNAQAAVAARPDWGLAHAVLARAYLELGDGLAADAELSRARCGIARRPAPPTPGACRSAAGRSRRCAR
ncbi:hypothetical protein QP162_02145 [Sphingomonas aurantiaca]|uniref:hypothetical protein n=1 Tax=Sphingomonas aurantiaca TaxID=185949 RepID=UPI002FE06BFB